MVDKTPTVYVTIIPKMTKIVSSRRERKTYGTFFTTIKAKARDLKWRLKQKVIQNGEWISHLNVVGEPTQFYKKGKGWLVRAIR